MIFFLLSLSNLFLPKQFRCRGLFFHVITHSHTTIVGGTPLDEGSARRRDFYLTTHNTHNRQTSMPPVGFEPVILAGDRLQTHALVRSATGIGLMSFYCYIFVRNFIIQFLYNIFFVSDNVCKTGLL
jgi:hypothetical protein